MEEADVIKKMDEWREQIVKVTNDYNVAIVNLKTIGDRVESQKKLFWVEYKTHTVVAVMLLFIVGALILLSRYSGWCSITIAKDGFSVQKNCLDRQSVSSTK